MSDFKDASDSLKRLLFAFGFVPIAQQKVIEIVTEKMHSIMEGEVHSVMRGYIHYCTLFGKITISENNLPVDSILFNAKRKVFTIYFNHPEIGHFATPVSIDEFQALFIILIESLHEYYQLHSTTAEMLRYLFSRYEF